MLSQMATAIQPMSKKNRHLVLDVASGCDLVELFLIHPPFLVGHMTWKHFYFTVIFYTISPIIHIVGCYYLAILTNVIEYS